MYLLVMVEPHQFEATRNPFVCAEKKNTQEITSRDQAGSGPTFTGEGQKD
jgi:hypothetical protein